MQIDNSAYCWKRVFYQMLNNVTPHLYIQLKLCYLAHYGLRS